MTERDDSFTVPTITFGSVELGRGPELNLGTELDLDLAATPELDLNAVPGLDTSPGPGTDPDPMAPGEASPVVAEDETPAAPQARPSADTRPASGSKPKATRRGGRTRTKGHDTTADRPPRPLPHVLPVPGGDSATAPPMPQQPALFPPEWPGGGAPKAGARQPQGPWRPPPRGVHRQQGFYLRRPPEVRPHGESHIVTVVKFIGKVIPLILLVWFIGSFVLFLQSFGSP